MGFLDRFSDKFGSRRQWNAVFYDSTDTQAPQDVKWPAWMAKMFGEAEPASLTWWWKLGSVFQSGLENADYYLGASYWASALAGLTDEMRRVKREGEKIGLIQLWGHGAPGRSYVGSSVLTVQDLRQGSDLYPLLDVLRKEIDNEPRTALWFRNCSVFHGERGLEFARAFQDFFRCTIIAHTYLIAGLQSGTHVLEPHEEPDWSVDEGGVTEKDGWPSVWAPNTILATDFYPPRAW